MIKELEYRDKYEKIKYQNFSKQNYLMNYLQKNIWEKLQQLYGMKDIRNLQQVMIKV